MGTCSTPLKHRICWISRECECKTTKGLWNATLQQINASEDNRAHRNYVEFYMVMYSNFPGKVYQTHHFQLALHGTSHLQNNPSPQKKVLTNMLCHRSYMMEIRKSWGLGVRSERRESRINVYLKWCLLLVTYS